MNEKMNGGISTMRGIFCRLSFQKGGITAETIAAQGFDGGIFSVDTRHKNNHTFRCGYFYGYREDFTCPAEVNSACTKVLAFGQNTCTAQKRRGPEGRFSEMLYLFRMHMPKSRLSAAAESLLFV